jgi:A/G-specific adenine glycosylase
MTDFSRQILTWYARHKRKLPWRGYRDPYAIWISEVMLQQTQVVTVIPYFKRWMKRFPTVRDLAAASEQEVLAVWEGLGYYARARNLHRAAQLVVTEFGGQLPREDKALRRLPGIGRYAAAAIASIAFGLDEAALDGNVRRVFARAFNVSTLANSTAGESILWSLAGEHLPKGRAGEYNQALMDLGSTICLPKNPLCPRCPIRAICQACALGIQEQRPKMKPKVAIPTRIFSAAIITRKGKVLLARRPSKGLLGGMWEFPNGLVDENPAGDLITALEERYHLRARPESELGHLRHAYTHFKLTEHIFLCTLKDGEISENLRWVSKSELSNYPMGRVDRQIALKISSLKA